MSSPKPYIFHAVYQRVLEHCSSFTWPEAWNFLKSDGDCYGPVSDPENTLLNLRDEFGDAVLEEAGVVGRQCHGATYLRPSLTNNEGALIALRERPQENPFDILTACGCLSGSTPAALTALRDSRTLAQLEETEVLYTTFRISEVVLLRALGLPATLAVGIHKAGPHQLRVLDEKFGEQNPFASAGDRALLMAADPGTPRKHPAVYYAAAQGEPVTPGYSLNPTLALLAWSPWLVTDHIPPMVGRTTRFLVSARQHLGLHFPGIWVWRPSPEELANLKFRMKFRDRRLIKELIEESTNALDDFGRFSDSRNLEGVGTTQAIDFISAQADLLITLAEGRSQGRMSNRVQAARRTYDALVESELIAPLQAWALESQDPVIRALGVAVSDVCRHLHRMSPLVHEARARGWEGALDGHTVGGAETMLNDYIKTCKQLGGLLRDICHWKHQDEM